MISIQKQFLFVHVPKTGGNSIQNVLKRYSEDEIVINGVHQDGIERFGVRNARYEVSKHSPLSQYQSVMEPDIFNALFKFAVIRNPWDMLVSFYFSPHGGVQEWNRDGFLNMVKSIPTMRCFIAGLHSRSQDKLDDNVDFLMRFEHLHEDFKLVCEKIGIPHVQLPHRNRSEREHYSNYYDEEMKEIVHNKFREEIAFGDYRFEEHPSHIP